MFNGKKYLTTFMIVSILISLIALSSCSGIFDSNSGENKIPDTYTTYRDKNGLYSISIPPNSKLEAAPWESDSLNAYWINNNSPKIPQKNLWKLCTASNPGMLLSVQLLPKEELTKDQFYIWALQDPKAKDYLKEILRIDGKEVAIFENINLVWSVVRVKQTLWLTTCAGDERYKKELHIIARSLRILK
jgi:hypothetical protein